jgi:hypothetical protein
MSSDTNNTLRQQLKHALRGDQSHVDFESAIGGLSAKLAGLKPDGSPHTAWQLLEHLRIAQSDILEFSRNPKHKSPQWPDGYWPDTDAPPNPEAWDASIAAFRKDAQAMDALIADSKADLYASIQGGTGQTLLREALVLACHNSYHLGQLVFLKKMLLSHHPPK